MNNTDLDGTILGVWAHPDDETYLSAGIMAEAVRRGARVVCVTATRGEAGVQDAERWPPDDLAQIREDELALALSILGVTEHVFLDYPDGGCDRILYEEVVDRLKAIIDDVRPTTVLTFGPDGLTGHPDHIAISAWTTDAFLKTALPGARLYYATTTIEWAEEFVPVLNGFNAFMSDGPPITAREDLAIDYAVSGDLLELKLKALRAQASQTESFINAVGEDLYRRAIAEEPYVLAAEQPFYRLNAGGYSTSATVVSGP